MARAISFLKAMDLTQLNIADIRRGLAERNFSAQELITSAQNRINRGDQTLGAFLRLRGQAQTEAAEVDRRIATGEPMRALEGVPIATKDNLCLAGEPVTAASRILEPYRAVYTATAVARLQAAGAIVVGQTNLDEYAMGASTENSAYQPTRNPWRHDLVPGGSSGGSAAAVATNMVVAALGSDTGGSIRQPAAFCNVVGVKPTYGRVSRYGLIALASSLDQIGPLTRNIDDAMAVYRTMAGYDDDDATSQDRPVNEGWDTIDQPISGLRIGLPKEYFATGVDPRIAATVQAAARELEKLGAKLTEVSIPHAPDGLATYYIILPAEASSNLARYDGIRYGLSDRSGKVLYDVYAQSRGQGFGPEVKRRITIGTFSLSAGYSEAYYKQAVRVRNLIREEFHRVFDQVDVLLGPVSPTLPFPLGARTQDPLTMYQADLLTVPVNLAEIPALSLPAGFIEDLPVGLQLMGKKWDEATIFRVARAYQGVTDWHTRRPPE